MAEIRSYRIAYFSPTGNTRHLAKRLADKLNVSESKIIDIAAFDKVGQMTELLVGDHLILMFSVHGFNAPAKVITFAKQLEKGDYSKASIIAVGCNDIWLNEGVSMKLRSILKTKGCKLMVDSVIAMPLTFIMAFPDDLCRKLIGEGEVKIEALGDAILKDVVSDKNVPLKSMIINGIGKIEKPAARLFGLELHANKKCVSCGKCWRDCPSGNIKESKKSRPSYGFKCIMCMKCIYECPEHAVKPYVSTFIPIKGGYDINDFLED